MSKDISSALEEQFKQECLVISVKDEYPDYTGTEKWIIITDLSDDELMSSYGSMLVDYSPYIKLSVRQGKPIIIFHRNEDKHRKRRKLYESLLPDCDGEDELYSKLAQEDFVSQLVMSDYIRKLLEALPTEKQRRRIVLHYIFGFTAVEIAEMENVSSQAVDKSLHAGIRYLKKFLE